MMKPSPRFIARIEDCLQQFQRDFDHLFPDFLQVARHALPERSNEARFPFVVYRIWRDRGRWRSWDWEELVTEEYAEIEENFEWTPAEIPKWVDQHLVEKTLAVWQPRYPRKLSAKNAVEILLNSTDLAVVSGGAE